MANIRQNTVPYVIGDCSVERAARLETDLERALVSDEIEVRFQPQFSCGDGAMIGAEALARWRHPALGEIGARDLFAVADRAGLVAPLSRVVVAKALERAATWPEHLQISLNITPEELADPHFAATFARVVGNSGIDPSRMMLEITEEVLLSDLELAREALESLQAAGLRIALDDFGAGFCNFRYLKMLPLSAIKLDRSMVEGIARDPRDLAVLQAIIALARALDLDIIAEGIETEAQREVVMQEGCSYYQGFISAQPMRSEDMLARFAGDDDSESEA